MDKMTDRDEFDLECQKAAKKQDLNRSLRLRYRDDAALQANLRQKLIDDLLRVYQHPLNPYKGFAASRQRYRQLGHYPEVMVVDFMGTHQEFLRAAGLHDSRATSKGKNRAALHHTHRQIEAYAQKNLKPWENKYPKSRGKKHLEIVIGSDFHSYFVDPFALEVFKDCLRMVQPDIVILNGDIFDFPRISKHRQIPGGFHLNIQQEIDWGITNIMRPVRELCPDAEILFVIGNHEYRFVTYLADFSPEIACLDTMNFHDLFKLDELEMSLVCRSSFMAPTAAMRKKDIAENWVKVGGCYVVTHGVSCAQFAAAEQLKKYQVSGTSGHTHRPQIISANTLGTGNLTWMTTPMMASYAVGREYVPEPSAWTMGFGVASINVEKGLVSQSLVQIHNDWASFAGQTWTPTKKTIEERAKQWEIGA